MDCKSLYFLKKLFISKKLWLLKRKLCFYMFCGSVLLELIEVIVIADLIYMVMGMIIKNLGTKRRLKVSCH